MSHYVSLPAGPVPPVPEVIVDDPSNVPLVVSPPPHPHQLFSRLLSWPSRSYCNRCIFLLYALFTYGVSVLLMMIGVQYKDEDGAGQLCLWLMVASLLLFAITSICLLVLLILLMPSCRSASPLILPLLICLILIESLFCLVWFIIGNVWFYLSSSSSTSPSLLRLVFFSLIYGYVNIVLQPVISLLGWGVHRGCPCIKRSAKGREREDLARRTTLSSVLQEQQQLYGGGQPQQPQLDGDQGAFI